MKGTREIHRQRTGEIKLGIVDGQVDSIRSRQLEEVAVRLYEGGRVGLASAVGEPDVGALTKQARRNLDFGIPYPEPLPARTWRSSRGGLRHDAPSLMLFAEEILAPLRERFPELVFGRAITHQRVALEVEGDQGRSLSHAAVSTSALLTVKERGSTNSFDTFVHAEHPELTAEGVVALATDHLQAFLAPRPALPAGEDGKHRVVFAGLAASALARPFQAEALARPYATGASIFSGKMGRKLFSDRFTLVDSRDWRRRGVPPFDAEGVIRKALDHRLFSAGVLRSVAADRRDAEGYELPCTGSAVGGLDQLPRAGMCHLELAPTAPTLAELLAGEPAILVWLELAGDFTRAGEVAIPAMTLLELDGAGLPVGRLPAATLAGNLYEIFGADLAGVSAQTVHPFSAERCIVTRMKLV